MEENDIAELFLENICFLTGKNKISFTHQYFRDYFAAKYVLNLIQALNSSFDICHSKQKAELFQKYHLHEKWTVKEESFDIYQLIGEICGDYHNIPPSEGYFFYQKTILDEILDLYREFESFCPKDSFSPTTENIIAIMSIVRKGLVCGVKFNQTNILIPFSTQFSLNGKYPCQFEDCVIDAPQPILQRSIHCMTYAPRGKTLLLGLEKGLLALYDIFQKKITHHYHLYQYSYEFCFDNAQFSPDEN